jgi:hypothetical protein
VQKYVTARELAGKLGTRERYVIDTLTAHGIKLAPTSGPKQPIVTIYLCGKIPANLPYLHDAKWLSMAGGLGPMREAASRLRRNHQQEMTHNFSDQ